MLTPMAIVGMAPVEFTEEEFTDPETWEWTPEAKDKVRLMESVSSVRITSRATGSHQTDTGEQY